MKKWNNPELNELSISNTEYWARKGTSKDGQYVSIDGKYKYDTFSGNGENVMDPEKK